MGQRVSWPVALIAVAALVLLVVTAYRRAGDSGTGPRILIRRVWLGPPPLDVMNAQMARFRAVGPADLQAHWDPDGGLVSAEDGPELAERLHDAMVRGGCDAINLRVFQAGLSPADVRDQIARLGKETLPRLRALLNE